MDASDDRDLVAACLWAAALFLAVALSDGGFVRTFLGLPMVLVVAGHAPLRALGVPVRGWPEHLLYALGAAISVGILGGFVLHGLGRMTPLGWASWYLAVALVASVAAKRLKAPPLPPFPRVRKAGFRPLHGCVVALSLLVAGGAYALSRHDEETTRQFKYTEFWLLPSSGGASFDLGIRSGETATMRFDIEVSLGGKPYADFRSIDMAPGGEWTRRIDAPTSVAPLRAEAKLYRSDDGTLYRHVTAAMPAESRGSWPKGGTE